MKQINIKNKIDKLIPTLKSNSTINTRIKEFEQVNKSCNLTWFNELCFCLLTANSKAKTALAIQNEMGKNGFFEKSQPELSDVIRKHGHRFHNKKSEYIVLAKTHLDIKEKIYKLPEVEAREFLVKNIKGLGFKEASHFLRNVGFVNVAIIDRHILRYLHKNELITEIPKIITKKHYLIYEEILKEFQIPLNKLDLIIWEKMTGEVLK